ncbi:hypothetical protein DBR42_05025, partial [Pelomonas sp. HMWF004]
LLIGQAQAIQPVEMGLLPLKERLAAIDGVAASLQRQLASDDAQPHERAEAWRRLQALAAEREQLARQVAATRRLAANPLVMYAAPGAGAVAAEAWQTRP